MRMTGLTFLSQSLATLALVASPAAAASLPADPLHSPMWEFVAGQMFGDGATVRFDPRLKVDFPSIAENQRSFPVAIDARGIAGVPTNPSHNAELIKDMMPSGVLPQAGGMNKEFILKITAPGLYGVKCRPHYAMGMVALIQVGAKPANLAAARAAVLPGLAAKRMAPMIAAVR